MAEDISAERRAIPSDLSLYQAQMAEERTTLARQRNILALERTFSAWIRTALSLNAVALIMPRLIETGRWLGIERILGVVLTITAAVMYYIALLRYHVASEKLAQQGIEVTSHRWIDAMIAALIFCTLLSLVLLFREI
jgi:putative membrane protein